MDNTVLVAIITGVVAVLTTLITVWLPIRQKNKELKVQNDDLNKKVEHMASTGVAIGYYFNFIEMVYKVIAESKTIKLEITDASKGITEIHEFD